MAKARRIGVTYETVRRIALAFPDVEDGLSYGTPALKVKGKLFVRLRPDLDSVVLKMPFERRDELMAAEPESYYITEHYLRYPWVLVRLANARAEALPELLQTAYRAALPVKRRAT
jgi:hypothetical protein